ncbi:unnamed protein product [Rotaria sp. Silwood2]|nr:unnamed protein product [Rotaria sp. Silwood2]
MPKSGSCTDITCDGEVKELYECHCCLRLVCLTHLIGHVEIKKQNQRRLDNLRNELNTGINTLKLIVEEKLLIIEREQNLIEQAKKCLDIPNSLIDELQNILEKISQTIASNRSDVETELKISKDDEYSMDIDRDFIDIVSFDESTKSVMDQHVNEKQEKHKPKTFIEVFGKCPLTFDGAYGLTKANHSVKLCEQRRTRRIELYRHFTQTHLLKQVYAQRLAEAVDDNQNPRLLKLFDENEDVIDHFIKVPCPFFYERINSSEYTRRNAAIPSCRHRLVELNKLKRHLRLYHNISTSLARNIVDDFNESRIKNNIACPPLNSST